MNLYGIIAPYVYIYIISTNIYIIYIYIYTYTHYDTFMIVLKEMKLCDIDSVYYSIIQ